MTDPGEKFGLIKDARYIKAHPEADVFELVSIFHNNFINIRSVLPRYVEQQKA